MSTNYRFDKELNKNELLKSLKKIGVVEHKTEQSSDNSFCISDGENYMWCYNNEDGVIYGYCRYGGNYDAEEFLAHVANDLQIEYLSEHDDGFWEDEDEDEYEEEE